MNVGEPNDAVDKVGVFLQDFVQTRFGFGKGFGIYLGPHFFKLLLQFGAERSAGSIALAKGVTLTKQQNQQQDEMVAHSKMKNEKRK